jgi:hypothetical protein
MDNTAYYLNPASTTNVNAMVSYSYQGNGNVGGTGSASWHPSGIYSAGYNWLYGGINGGGGSATNFGDVRANIFYDYNDTGYYIDPASYQRINGGIEMSIYSGHTYVANGQSWGYCYDCCTSDWNGNCGFWNSWRWGDCGNCGRTVHHRMTVNGGIAAYSFWDWSDSHIKSDVSTIPNALAMISKLRGVTYKLIEPKEDGASNYDKNKDFDRTGLGPQIGFIAQEVQEVLPQVVKEMELKDPSDSTMIEHRLGMEYGKITALLVEGMKEQQKMIDELKFEIAQLKSPNAVISRPTPEQAIETTVSMLEGILHHLQGSELEAVRNLIADIKYSNDISYEQLIIIEQYRKKFGLK